MIEVEIPKGTRLDEALRILRGEAVEQCSLDGAFAEFNGRIIDSNMTIEEAYHALATQPPVSNKQGEYRWNNAMTIRLITRDSYDEEKRSWKTSVKKCIHGFNSVPTMNETVKLNGNTYHVYDIVYNADDMAHDVYLMQH